MFYNGGIDWEFAYELIDGNDSHLLCLYLRHTFSRSQTALQTIVCVHTLAYEDVFTKVSVVSSSIQSLY